ncbi:putative PDDEXK endonuclease [Streptomyces cinereoruber]|uniref:putative PDDEXK endonuclease n=1 Tax=Streptomyces cinereoruber TaxID=67260 RepID=UPI00364211C4
MSESSEKGRSLEDHVAKTLNKKLGVKVARDKRSGAGSHQKMDIADWFKDVPLDIEVKNHKVIKLPEWMRQAKHGASVGQVPTVVFACDGDVIAALPFDAVVDMMAEIKQLRAEVASLRAPVVPAGLPEVTVAKVAQGASSCRNGHLLSPGASKCLMKGCPYSSSYKPRKEKK